jgi:ankyrin repeat protein
METGSSVDDLIEAVKAGDEQRVVALLDEGVDVNGEDRFGINSQTYAIQNRKPERTSRVSSSLRCVHR